MIGTNHLVTSHSFRYGGVTRDKLYKFPPLAEILAWGRFDELIKGYIQDSIDLEKIATLIDFQREKAEDIISHPGFYFQLGK